MKNEISQFKGEENRHEHINSDEEEEMVKNIISNKGQYMAFMQVRNLKDILNKYKYHDVSSPLLMRKKIKTDVSLLKASNILSKTYKNDIYNEECIDIVKKTCEKGASHTHDHQFTPKSNLTPYILLTALSLYGLFEGVALGLQKDFKSTIFLGLAILSHKWAESFTLGISFYKINTDDKLYIKLILLYSVFTPLGILIGVLLSSSNLFLESLFLSLSAGTFIYISASELIIEEFSVSKYKYEKFCFYLLGAFIIGGMSFLEIKLNVNS
jgi:zinc transporter ZupT